MIKLRFVWLIIYLCIISEVKAQVSLEWVVRYNGTANRGDAGFAIISDDSGYVYVTGGAVNSGSFEPDYITIKYSSTGDTVWAKIYIGPENGFDVARDIAIDDSGNVFITGTSVAATIKYDKDGNEIWLKRYGLASGGVRLLLDTDNNIIVGGGNLNDYMILKYDNEGNLLWANGYDGPANDWDIIYDIVLDSKNNIIVTGDSRGVETEYDYATIKYSPDGDTLWVRRYNGLGPSTPSDHAFAITVDDSDNIYVTGWSDGLSDRPQCATIKYSPEGYLMWSHRFPNGGTPEYAGYDIMHLRGFIYVAARAHFFNDTLLKYDLYGNLIWTRAFVTVNVDTHNKILASDKFGNIYMTSGGGVSPGSDYIVLKYNPDGDLLWEYRYRPGSNASSRAMAIYVDTSLNVYLTGEATGMDFDMYTLKLSQDTTTNVQEINLALSEFTLFPAYPNPFNSSTNIKYTIPQSGRVSIKAFDLMGREIQTLIDRYQESGSYDVMFQARDLASGIYFYTLTSGNFMATKKLILLK